MNPDRSSLTPRQHQDRPNQANQQNGDADRPQQNVATPGSDRKWFAPYQQAQPERGLDWVDSITQAAWISRLSGSRVAIRRVIGSQRAKVESVGRQVLPATAGSDNEGRCPRAIRSEEHTSELQSLMRISYAVFCL